jgi:hypothetical protein
LLSKIKIAKIKTGILVYNINFSSKIYINIIKI